MGINNGLRAKDLVCIRYRQVEGAKPGAVINIVETKTGKNNILVINKAVHKALQAYLAEVEPAPDDFLFKSRKGSGHISSQSIGRMVRSWASAINLKGQYGAHTLRKTWGYQQRIAMAQALKSCVNATTIHPRPSRCGIWALKTGRCANC